MQMTLNVEELDVEPSPLNLYARLRGDYSYLLESVDKTGKHSRFSFIGHHPEAILTIKDHRVTLEYPEKKPLVARIIDSLSIFLDDVHVDEGVLTGRIPDGCDVPDALRAGFPRVEIRGEHPFDRHVFVGGLMGYLSYDIIYDFIGTREKPPAETPDAQFTVTSETIIIDHQTSKVYLAQAAPDGQESGRKRVLEKLEASPTPGSDNGFVGTPCSSMTQEEYEEAVRRIKQHVFDGDVFQALISRYYEVETTLDSFEIYRRLRQINPSPYMYLLEFDDVHVIGASPEALFTIYGQRLTVNPIAGTCPRGRTQGEDAELAREMLGDEKERAEHVMLVDLARNDVRRVCQPGTVNVADYMSVLRYSHVQHIESTVEGQLRPECDQFDATRAVFPAGTLSGAPKPRALEIIHDAEGARGIYGGGVGYYSFTGDADFAITIRTLVRQRNTLRIQSAAGIVQDSDPTKEYLETQRKMDAMLNALEGGVQ